MEETRVPVYLITGFLESGKTSFLSFTLQAGLLSDRWKNTADPLRRG